MDEGVHDICMTLDGTILVGLMWMSSLSVGVEEMNLLCKD